MKWFHKKSFFFTNDSFPYKTFWRLYQRSVHPVHLVVQTARVAQVLAWKIIVNHNHHILAPVPSRRQRGVDIAPQLTHSRPSPMWCCTLKWKVCKKNFGLENSYLWHLRCWLDWLGWGSQLRCWLAWLGCLVTWLGWMTQVRSIIISAHHHTFWNGSCGRCG